MFSSAEIINLANVRKVLLVQITLLIYSNTDFGVRNNVTAEKLYGDGSAKHPQTTSQSLSSNSTAAQYAAKFRNKRDSGEGKFAEAATSGQMKLLRLWLQLFKNMISGSNVGGMHPLHPSVPKTFVNLIKENVVTMFVPEVGNDAKKH